MNRVDKKKQDTFAYSHTKAITKTHSLMMARENNLTETTGYLIPATIQYTAHSPPNSSEQMRKNSTCTLLLIKNPHNVQDNSVQLTR